MVLLFLSEFRLSLGVPTDLHYGYVTLFCPFKPPVHDFHMFLDEVETLVYFNFVKWNDKSLIREALLQVIHMEGGVYVTEFLW